MISLTGILGLLSALAATSSALSCMECISPISLSCTGSSKTCPSGYQCGAAYTQSTILGETTYGIVRECVPSSKCNFKGTVSLKDGQIKVVSSCCNTNDCTPTTPDFPRKSSKNNGVVCPSCLSVGSTSCSSSDTVQCTGEEDMCVLQTSTITAGIVSTSTAIKGCATKSICDIRSESQNIQGISIEAKNICTSGGTSVHKVILTPAIACLLLLKILF